MSIWKASYKPSMKANQAIIQACINEAIEWKKRIEDILQHPNKNCLYIINKANQDKPKTIHMLAMENLGYKRLRASLGTRKHGDYPWDRPAFEWWHDKTNTNYLKTT